MLFLRPEDTRGLITMSEAIEAVALGFREWADNRELNQPRRRVHAPSGVRVSVHQGASPKSGVSGLLALGIMIRQSAEAQKAERHSDAVYTLFDADSGDLTGIVVGDLTPAEAPQLRVMAGLRTAAASAVGTDALARRDARTLGLIGGGRQARYHLLAFSTIRKLELIKVFRRNAEQRAAFAKEMSDMLKIEVRPVDSARAAVEDSDIILAATNSSVPVFDGDWLQPGQHVTSIVGSNVGLLRSGQRTRKRREIDDRTVARMDVIAAASREQAIADEQGDLFDPIESGLIKPEDIRNIGDIMTGRVAGRSDAAQLTLFKNNAGQGICDIALVGKVLARARERKLGIEMPFGGY
jgi:ornithine cyclodeaminase/alanine dehydrogenase-like protein (mu-crystallin family)